MNPIDWAAVKADATRLLIDVVWDRAGLAADVASLLTRLGAPASLTADVRKLDWKIDTADALAIVSAVRARNVAAVIGAVEHLAADLKAQLAA